MKGIAAVGAVFALAGAAWAQNQADPVEERVRRLRESLQLTEDQTIKAREIYKKQFDDIRGILTDDQKRRYDEMNSGRGGQAGNRGNQGFGGRGGFGGNLPSTDELKTQLSLTDDQVTKINAFRDSLREEIRNFFRNRPQGQDFQAWMEKTRNENTAKIREVLTEEQKPKFDEIVKNAQSQPQPTPGQSGRGGRGSSLDERVARVMETLRVEKPEEAEAVKAVVRRVLELSDKYEAAQRDGRSKIDDASRNRELSDEAVGDRIDEVRKATKDAEKELNAARKDLAEIVTNRQELELIRRGLLR
jgi:hypothetical protein